MRYGYFDDQNREYVITRPDTPLPWINYLGMQDYFGLISNTAGGYSFYQDARLRRLTRWIWVGGISISRMKVMGNSGRRPGCQPEALLKTIPAGMDWVTRSLDQAFMRYERIFAMLSLWVRPSKFGI